MLTACREDALPSDRDVAPPPPLHGSGRKRVDILRI